jgi:transcriptional regulator with XRE-family HTH domain
MNNDPAWLEKLVAEEDYGPVSAGGWIGKPLEAPGAGRAVEPSWAFAQLVEYARRRRKWTLEDLAREADVDLAALVAIKRNLRAAPEPRTVYQLAQALQLPADRLMQLAGLAVARDEKLAQAAVRFAARSEPTAQLAHEEQAGLREIRAGAREPERRRPIRC